MVEKKCTRKTATAKKAAKKETVACKKANYDIDAINVGFRAGDVYEALATAKKALSVAELAKEAKISEEEVLLGMGWLLKEGKITDENGLVVLA